jgi:predicted DNA-binding transcriptional regulator AlpA
VNSELNVMSVDTKGLVKMTGFCRQRLSAIRKDATLGFPEPSQVGRSLRWLVSDIVQWLQAMKRSNAALLVDLASRKVPVGLKSTKTTRPPNPWPWALVTKTEKPTLAEVQAANVQICAIRLKPGQVRIGRSMVTREGTSVMRYSVAGVPHQGAMPPLTIRRKVTFGADVAAQTRARYLAGSADALADARHAKTADEKPRQREGQGDGVLPELFASLEVSLVELKNRYESGSSLDALCAQYRMGKSRLSKLLREANAQMRPAGRKPR